MQFHRQFRVAAVLACFCWSGLAQPSLADANTRRVNGISDAQIVSVVRDWMQVRSDKCTVQFSRDMEKQLQKDVKETLFAMAKVKPAKRAKLDDLLHGKVTEALDDAMKDGVFEVVEKNDFIFVTITGC
ncbi:hypothetical protein [Epibacterium ulvae]|uniref:hypothetical protein n=1 Tax=Epibacterium ulvae TaxID=1156985 RepID=UPI00248FAE9F|nr:hypothetical protein [Epibacterium ulvae]